MPQIINLSPVAGGAGGAVCGRVRVPDVPARLALPGGRAGGAGGAVDVLPIIYF